jgi:hypothetical protein
MGYTFEPPVMLRNGDVLVVEGSYAPGNGAVDMTIHRYAVLVAEGDMGASEAGFDRPGAFNPANDANRVLARYLPGLGHAVKDAYGVYQLDSFQLAELILSIEAATAHRDDLERMERQMIPLLNSIRRRLGKPGVIAPKGPPGDG